MRCEKYRGRGPVNVMTYLSQFKTANQQWYRLALHRPRPDLEIGEVKDGLFTLETENPAAWGRCLVSVEKRQKIGRRDVLGLCGWLRVKRGD